MPPHELEQQLQAQEAERQRQEAEERNRLIEASRPDREKMLAYIAAIQAVPLPPLADTNAARVATVFVSGCLTTFVSESTWGINNYLPGEDA
jgi:hypothetical protein